MRLSLIWGSGATWRSLHSAAVGRIVVLPWHRSPQKVPPSGNRVWLRVGVITAARSRVGPPAPAVPPRQDEILCDRLAFASGAGPAMGMEAGPEAPFVPYDPVTKGYGSSWIFGPCLTCANALRRVQHPAFSLV
jgi:hypothetical protein